jgi:hypothetical protein
MTTPEPKQQKMFYLTAIRTDGSEIEVWPNIYYKDGEWEWKYLVPDDIANVAGLSVNPGDTVHGKIQVT